MEKTLESFLTERGVKKETLVALEAEDIVTMSIFKGLKMEHVHKLGERSQITVGQHSLLYTLWEDTAVKHTPAMTSGSYSTRKQLPSSSASSSNSSDPETRKELFEAYRARMTKIRQGEAISEPKAKTTKPTKKGRCVAIHLGGMVFCPLLRRGLRKKTLPPPQLVDFLKSSTYEEVLAKGKEIFFEEEEEEDLSSFSLANSAGIPFTVDTEDWTLGDFMHDHAFQPSKLRLYVLFTPSEDDNLEIGPSKKKVAVCASREVSPAASPQDHGPPPLVHTVLEHTSLCVVACKTCHKEFLAPTPNTICDLPDGGSVSYSDCILECPLCDINGFGESWNRDFMDELKQ